jgi:nitrogenase molybdenum-iron protein beta chain
MVKSIATSFPEKSTYPNDTVNLIAGWIEPSDMKEIKRLAAMLKAKGILFPDTSGVLDTPQTGTFKMYPKGGTSISDLIAVGNSKHTIGIGSFATRDAAIALENKCKIPFDIVDIPIGLSATDRFIQKLARAAELPIPESLTEERGQLVDVITDMHQYLYGKRVALWGDPDQLIPLVEFLVDLDMKPVYIISGTPGKEMARRLQAILEEKVPEAKYKNGEVADMYLLHQWIKNEPVDLLIGNTYGKYISRDENIPFLRMGFPILDRIGHSYFPTLGYMGGIRILEKILGLFMDKQDAESSEVKFELTM